MARAAFILRMRWNRTYANNSPISTPVCMDFALIFK